MRTTSILAVFSACLISTAALGECDNSSLVVDAQAEGVKYRGCWQVEYVVQEGFPAKGLIQRISKELASQGWRALDTDPFATEEPDCVVHAWTTHQAKDRQQTTVDQWLGWFEREDDSRLQLALRYFGRDSDDEAPRPVITSVTFFTSEQWQALSTETH